MHSQLVEALGALPQDTPIVADVKTSVVSGRLQAKAPGTAERLAGVERSDPLDRLFDLGAPLIALFFAAALLTTQAYRLVARWIAA